MVDVIIHALTIAAFVVVDLFARSLFDLQDAVKDYADELRKLTGRK